LTPVESPIPQGTEVTLDEHATFLDRDLVSGGSPWRLLRLTGASLTVAGRWQGGGVVQAGEERFARTLIHQGLLHPHFAGTFNSDEIDVIVPVFDDVSSLRVLLGQLKGFHVTVVDDNSSNANDVATCAEEFGATLLRLDRNQGPAHARNVAGVPSTREFLWFVADDVFMS